MTNFLIFYFPPYSVFNVPSVRHLGKAANKKPPFYQARRLPQTRQKVSVSCDVRPWLDMSFSHSSLGLSIALWISMSRTYATTNHQRPAANKIIESWKSGVGGCASRNIFLLPTIFFHYNHIHAKNGSGIFGTEKPSIFQSSFFFFFSFFAGYAYGFALN